MESFWHCYVVGKRRVAFRHDCNDTSSSTSRRMLVRGQGPSADVWGTPHPLVFDVLQLNQGLTSGPQTCTGTAPVPNLNQVPDAHSTRTKCVY